MSYHGDLEVCNGFSYHNVKMDSVDHLQGPEWLWPTGFILEALDYFPPTWLRDDSLQYQCSLIHDQLLYLKNDEWMSLPEMTNHDGEYNGYSCRAQAWSVGCLLWFLLKRSVNK